MNPKTVPPDQEQRDRALSVDESFIVQAPAGSGKTTLLVQRFLNLLTTVSRPEEVLAITFTRAAAAEMKLRVLEEMEKNSPLTQAIMRHDEANNWQLRRNPHLLRIQTIDSFATELATQIPGIQSAEGMRIEENPQPLYQQAASDVLAKLFTDDASAIFISEFLSALDNNASSAERLLTIMLGKRDQWLDVATLVASTAFDDLADVQQIQRLGVIDVRQRLLDALQAKLSASDQQMILRLGKATGVEPTVEELLPTLLKKNGGIRQTVDRRQGEAFTDKPLRADTIEWLRDLEARQFAGLLHACSLLPDIEQDPSTLIAASVTLALAAAELEASMRRRRCIDFTGILMKAGQGLRDGTGPTDLALFWDYRVKHLLVDEFQDTSRSQYRFFSLLTEGWSPSSGNTFFAVGDPMQSIYRFRDADVSIFSQCWAQGLPNVALEPIQLKANFRSSASLVDWNNALFTTLFPATSLPELGAIAFSPALAQLPDDETDRGKQLRSFANEEEEAEAITCHIAELIRERTPDSSENIGILCRARTHLPVLLKALKQANIRYTSTEIDPLEGEPIVRDLLSLHKALLRPDDRLAWFALLRSPVVGLTLQQLEIFAPHTDVFAFATEQKSSSPALERFVEAIDWAKPRLYELPICEIVEGCWMRLGGVDAYEAASLTHAIRWFELLEAMADDALNPDLVVTKTAKLYAQDASDSSVQVMTIHKSKGLEFAHVILPNLGKAPPPEETDLLLWQPTERGLLIGIKQDSTHDWLAHGEKNRAENESKRLLYVACTRAAKSLWMSTSKITDKHKGLASYLAKHDTPNPQLAETIDKASDTRLPTAAQAQLIHLPSDYRWSPPADIRASTILDAAKNQADLPDAEDKTQDDRSNRYNLSLGNLVHRALAYIGDQNRLGWPINQSTIKTNIERWLPDLDAYPDQYDDVTKAALAHVERTMEDSTGRWALLAHDFGRFEWPVNHLVADQSKRLVIDRLFVSQNYWWIIDFKTSAPDHGTPLPDFFQQETLRYSAQLEQYAHVLRSLLAERPTSVCDLWAQHLPVKTALYFTSMGHLEELS